MNTFLKMTAGAIFLAICLFGNVFANVSATSENSMPSEDHVVTVGKLQVHYVESGSGRPVILIHGNPGGVEDFELGAMDSIAREYHVIAIDRPGHGGSDSTAASVEYQAELLHQTLSTLGIQMPILVGHSWGGSLALCYVLKYPTEVAAMVLLAPAAYADKGNIFIRAAAKIPFAGDLVGLLGKSVLSRGLLKRELANAFYPQTVPDKYFKVVSASWFGRKQLKAFFEDEADLNDCLKDMKGKYSSIKIPVVIVTGDQDRIVAAKENAYRLQKAIRGSRLVKLKNTGHEIPQTNPESILAALRLLSNA